MEKKITVEYKDHDRVILTDEVGNTYTSKSEELMDFLHGAKNISLNPDVSGSRQFSEDELREVAYQCWMNSDRTHARYLDCVKKEIDDLR